MGNMQENKCLTVEQIEEILRKNGGHIPAAGSYYFTCDPLKSAQAIHAAMPPVRPAMTEVLVRFLRGEGKLEGYWFGDDHPDGRYWWRSYLDAAMPRTPSREAIVGEIIEEMFCVTEQEIEYAKNAADAILALIEGKV